MLPAATSGKMLALDAYFHIPGVQFPYQVTRPLGKLKGGQGK